MNHDDALRDLYQEMILDHGRHPRHTGPLADATHHAEGVNPLCGDRLVLHLKIREGRLLDLRFEGQGCAISTASASLMCEALRGLATGTAEAVFARFHALVTGAGPADDLGKLAALAGVRAFPARVKCATLPWHTLHAALHGQAAPVSTE